MNKEKNKVFTEGIDKDNGDGIERGLLTNGTGVGK